MQVVNFTEDCYTTSLKLRKFQLEDCIVHCVRAMDCPATSTASCRNLL